MYFFHSHNIVGCLASIGDSGKMIHIPNEGTFVLLIVLSSSQTISTVAFFFRHSFFLCATLRVRKKSLRLTLVRSLRFFNYQEKRVPKRTNKQLKMQLPLLLLAAMAR